MKKKVIATIIGGIVVIVAVIGWRGYLADFIRDVRFQGSDLMYTTILTEGVREKADPTIPDSLRNYLYKSIGYKEDGSEVSIEFYGMDGRELPVGTYLEMRYREKEGVLSWKVIDRKEIPANLLEKIK